MPLHPAKRWGRCTLPPPPPVRTKTLTSLVQIQKSSYKSPEKRVLNLLCTCRLGASETLTQQKRYHQTYIRNVYEVYKSTENSLPLSAHRRHVGRLHVLSRQAIPKYTCGGTRGAAEARQCCWCCFIGAAAAAAGGGGVVVVVAINSGRVLVLTVLAAAIRIAVPS